MIEKADLVADAKYWEANGYQNDKNDWVEKCNSHIYRLGRVVDVTSWPYFKRNYENVPDHKTIYITLEMLLGGSWGANANVDLKISNGNNLLLKQMKLLRVNNMQEWESNLCSLAEKKPKNGVILNIYIETNH